MKKMVDRKVYRFEAPWPPFRKTQIFQSINDEDLTNIDYIRKYKSRSQHFSET